MKNCALTPGAELRIMTSNCLFDSTVPDRVGLLAENYRYYAPELLGLQEVNDKVHELLIPEVKKLGYEAVNAWPDPERRTEEEMTSLSPKYPKVNYHPILYRPDVLEEVEAGFFMYHRTYTYTKGLTWAVFRRRSDGKLLAHINTHCALVIRIYNLDRTDADLGNEWRLDNARQMLELCDSIRAKHGAIPVFLTGDFNCTEASPCYAKLIDAGLANSKYVSEGDSTHGISSFHPKVGTMPKSGDDTLPIDHVLLTPDTARVLRHSIETRPEVLNASDHCMVFADVALK